MILFTKIKLPYDSIVLLHVIVTAFVTPLIFKLLPILAVLTVNVAFPVKLPPSKIGSSWGNGTLPKVEPLEVVTHLVESAQLTAPEVCLKYCVWDVVKVTPVFPPQSPEPPVIPDRLTGLVNLISLKSTLEATTLAAGTVMVRWVPRVLEYTNVL